MTLKTISPVGTVLRPIVQFRRANTLPSSTMTGDRRAVGEAAVGEGREWKDLNSSYAAINPARAMIGPSRLWPAMNCSIRIERLGKVSRERAVARLQHRTDL